MPFGGRCPQERRVADVRNALSVLVSLDRGLLPATVKCRRHSSDSQLPLFRLDAERLPEAGVGALSVTAPDPNSPSAGLYGVTAVALPHQITVLVVFKSRVRPHVTHRHGSDIREDTTVTAADNHERANQVVC